MTAAAMPVRSVLYRARPWLSDGVWIAHESLQMFDRIAALLTHNGTWRLAHGGPRMVTGLNTPDLTAAVEAAFAAAVPATLAPVDFATAEPQPGEDWRNAAYATIGQRIEALAVNEAGAPVRALFDHSIVYGADCYTTRRLTWQMTTTGTPMLVGVDRKDRPRFVVASKRGAES